MAASSASCFVSGPVQWYVNTGENKSWQYLGMCENDVSVDLSSEWDDVMLDGGGFRLPFEKQFFGMSASVSGDLVRYDNTVLANLKNWLNQPEATQGQLPNGSIGALVRTEGLDFGLILTSMYATKDAYREAGAEPLLYFPWVTPVAMRKSLSTRATRERVAFDCNLLMNGLGGGVLYYTAFNGTLPPPT